MSHSIPDKDGFEASRQAIAPARWIQPHDIVFGCGTGGGPALMSLPVDGINLENKKEVNRPLLTCGANFYEINAV